MTVDSKSSLAMIRIRTEKQSLRVNVASVSLSKRLQHSLIEMAAQL